MTVDYLEQATMRTIDKCGYESADNGYWTNEFTPGVRYRAVPHPNGGVEMLTDTELPWCPLPLQEADEFWKRLELGLEKLSTWPRNRASKKMPSV